MDRFDDEIIRQAELRGKQLLQAAQQAQRLGWPEKACNLRAESFRHYEKAQTVREMSEHEDESRCQRPPC